MSAHFIEEGRLGEFLFGLGTATVYAQMPAEKGGDIERVDGPRPGQFGLRGPRAPLSPKSFLFPVKERVAVYPSTSYRWQPAGDGGAPFVLAGIRACDIAAMRLLDRVFIQEDYVDPFYSLRREAMRTVSVDCAVPAASCFCDLLGARPHAAEGFDVNLSPVEGGYVAEAGSEKGREMLVAAAGLFRDATPEQLAARDAMRAACEAKLAEQNGPFATAESAQRLVAAAIEDDRWLTLAAACVECGSCTSICPACHCFQLYDQPSDEGSGPNERMKAWDSCVLASYAKMAGVGGMRATPRPELRQRFANRIIHKFAWFPENMGLLGCVGCGRCIDSCLGGGDLRKLLKDLEPAQPPAGSKSAGGSLMEA